MYLEYFGLNTRPFRITPNTEFFYPGCRRGEILDALLYAISSGEGIVKVVGEVGSGKTMLCRVLETRLPENVDSLHVLNPSLGRDEMLHTIAEELGIQVPADERTGNIIRLLREHLITAYAAGRQVVLFIDEAQAVPLDTLEEVRLLSNLETDTHKLLQIVLLGQPELEQNLALPRTRQIRERITHSFNLPPMTREVVREYVMFRMRTAGYRGPDPFSDEAIKMIATASRGVTRLINILADKSLLAAFAADTHNVGKAHVSAAIRDSDPADAQPASGRSTWVRIAGASVALVAAAALGALMTHLLVQNNGAPLPAVQAAAQAVNNIPPAAPVALLAATEAEIQRDAAADTVSVETAAETKPLTAVATPDNRGTGAQQAPIASHLQRRIEATAQWLAATPGNHWTIQLGLAESPGQAERFIASAQSDLLLEQLYVYRVVAAGDERYAIAYGGFPERGSASSALAALPDHYRAWRAYPRTLRAIRSAMAEAVAVQ